MALWKTILLWKCFYSSSSSSYIKDVIWKLCWKFLKLVSKHLDLSSYLGSLFGCLDCQSGYLYSVCQAIRQSGCLNHLSRLSVCLSVWILRLCLVVYTAYLAVCNVYLWCDTHGFISDFLAILTFTEVFGFWYCSYWESGLCLSVFSIMLVSVSCIVLVSVSGIVLVFLFRVVLVSVVLYWYLFLESYWYPFLIFFWYVFLVLYWYLFLI